MKVYELISALSDMPAGAEVEFAILMNAGEFRACETVDLEDGQETHRITGKIKECEQIDSWTVTLYW